jgi:hypothetical protein
MREATRAAQAARAARMQAKRRNIACATLIFHAIAAMPLISIIAA